MSNSKIPGFLAAVEGVHGEHRLVPVDSIEPNPWNINRYTADEFGALKEGIVLLGRVQRARVRSWKPNNDFKQTWQLIDGEHNWRAARELGFTEFPVEVLEMNDAQAKKAGLILNQHGNAEEMATAELLHELQQEFGKQLREGIALTEQELEHLIEKASGPPTFPSAPPPPSPDEWVTVSFKCPETAAQVIDLAVQKALEPGEEKFLAFERMAAEFLAG